MSASPLELFFAGATLYYVTGRYAVLAGQSPVAGNLLHHAVEMYLKGGLSKSSTLQQLKKLNHELPEVWGKFKAQFSNAALSQFDNVIDSLGRFEDLRYPDSIIARGAQTTVGVTRVGMPLAGAALRPEPTYELFLTDVDALVRAVFTAVPVNPAFFFIGLSPLARQHLLELNDQKWAG